MATKAKDKAPDCKLSTIINRQFLMVRMIGKGGYGVVYECVRVDSPRVRLACKAELAVAHNNLKTEWDLMKLLKENNAKHNIVGVELGCERNFNYIVMHLVGPSLQDLRKACTKKTFTLYTTTVCAIQCFDSLVEIQKLGFIHRDVKPGNFAIGVLGSEEEKLIHVLDFGLCRNMFKNGEMRKPRMKAPFRGSLPYCSSNIHQRMEPGRHDDFWSLLYMMIEFHLSELPWEKMTKEETKKAKEKQIEELLSKCPAEFRMIRCYLHTLTYSKEPDYAKLRGILCQLMLVNKFTPDMPLDWQIGGECESVFRPRALMFHHKGNKKKVNLPELLNLPPPGSPLFQEADFPKPGEYEAQRDESVSKSDDTIVEKDGPPPAPKPAPKPQRTQPEASNDRPAKPPITAMLPPPPATKHVSISKSGHGSVVQPPLPKPPKNAGVSVANPITAVPQAPPPPAPQRAIRKAPAAPSVAGPPATAQPQPPKNAASVSQPMPPPSKPAPTVSVPVKFPAKK